MTNQFFSAKVRYTKQMENGTFKRVTEPYLLPAMTFTDAEARIYEELGTTIRGEFSVTGIAHTNIHDIFQYDDSDRWFKAKISYDKMDDEGDKKKTISQYFLVSAETVKEAYERIEESLSTLMVDYQITQIVASPIVDIFPYKDTETKSEENYNSESDEITDFEFEDEDEHEEEEENLENENSESKEV